MRRLAAAIALLAIASPILSQQDSATTLKPVVVTVTRGSGRTVLRSPYAITMVSPDSARPGQRHASIDETLATIPGLTSVSRNNPAQDARISIRGFGARSAFGVRGIRVMRDGMPITLPDGQTPLDYVSLESVDRVEVLRGAASALYGNASGGIIDLRTDDHPASPLNIEARQWAGSNSTSRTVLGTSSGNEASSFIGDLSYARTDGSRAHSSQRSTLGYGRAATDIGHNRVALTVMGLNNPLSENPGALTLEEMKADPEQADATSLRRNARKAVKQIQIGVSAERDIANTQLSLNAYGSARTLDNPLTFAVVEVGRHTRGAGALVRRKLSNNSFAAGFDAQWQNDLRRNFGVCADTVRSPSATAACPDPSSDRGLVTLDQRELVSSAGAFVSDDIELDQRFVVSAGIRADRVKFEVKDRLINAANPDDSGDRTLNALSPVAGILFRAAPTHSLYGNVSTAFETPTATELGNHADGSAGINQDLDPQRSLTFETGAKGWVGNHLRYDAAIFRTRVRDELVPFEIPSSNGRRYFRNAGRTRRNGAEIGVEANAGILSVATSYTYSDFNFARYSSGSSDFGGNTIPGIPAHRLQSALKMSKRGFFALVETEAAGKSWVDDANTFRAPSYEVTGIRAGASFSQHAYGTVVAGIQNLFDATYASSIVVNAARSKYFEPAPRRTFYLGLTVGARSK